MARPVKERRVCGLPETATFGPRRRCQRDSEGITLLVDEYEVIRLIDWEGLNQEKCAAQMEVARTTVQAIYVSARRKLAQMLVEGQSLRIEGGAYKLCDDEPRGCGRRCGRQRMQQLNNSHT